MVAFVRFADMNGSRVKVFNVLPHVFPHRVGAR